MNTKTEDRTEEAQKRGSALAARINDQTFQEMLKAKGIRYTSALPPRIFFIPDFHAPDFHADRYRVWASWDFSDQFECVPRAVVDAAMPLLNQLPHITFCEEGGGPEDFGY